MVAGGADVGAVLGLTPDSQAAQDVLQEQEGPIFGYPQPAGPPAAAPLRNSGTPVMEVAEKGATPLHLACRHGFTPGVMSLLDRGADVNAVTEVGGSVLRVAVCSGSAELVAELLRRGADMLAAPGDSHWYCDLDRQRRSRSAWHAAAGGGHLGAMEVMLPLVGNIDVPAAGGYTALHLACKFGRQDVAMLLLSRGADPLAVTEHGWSLVQCAAQGGSVHLMAAVLELVPQALSAAWHAACRAKQLEVVRYLLKRGADVNAVQGGDTALYTACYLAREDVALALLAHAKEAGVVLRDASKVLHAAASRCSNSVLSALLDLGADATSPRCPLGSAWHQVASKGLTAKVQLFLRAGAQVDACRDCDGATALYLASEEGHADVVLLLVQEGADVSVVTRYGRSALCVAVERNHMPVVSLLLRHGAHMHTVPVGEFAVPAWQTAASAWQKAAQWGRLEAIKLMLEHGALVNAASADGTTALHIVCQKAQADAAELLLAAGADVHAVTAAGCTALHNAASSACALALLAAGACVDAVTADGSTPLLRAVLRGDKPVVQCLLAGGANPAAARKDGMAPLHAAANQSWADGVRLLVEAVCKGSSDGVIGDGACSSAAHLLSAVALSLIPAGLQSFVNARAVDGTTALHLAIRQVVNYWAPRHARRAAVSLKLQKNRRNALDTALLLLSAGADVQVTTASGSSPLHLAACSCCVQLVEELLSRGAAVSAVAADGSTPLLHAVLCCEVLVVECLLGRGANPFASYLGGWTALHAAAKHGWYQGVQLLLEAARSWLGSSSSSNARSTAATQQDGAAVSAMQALVDARTVAGQTALHLVTDLVLDHGPLNSVLAAPGAEPASYRASRRAYGTAVLLLEAGADAHALADDGSSTLLGAALSRFTDRDSHVLMKRLLEKGVDPTAARSDGWTALHAVAKHGTAKGVQILVEAVRRCDVSSSHAGRTAARPLGAAAAGPNMQRFLNARTAAGHTALHLALPDWNSYESAREEELLEELLQAGASVDVLHGKPWWPEGATIRHPQGWPLLSLLPRLFVHGAEPDLSWPPDVSSAGMLLHWAVQECSSEVAQLVLLGADTAALDAEGATPWHVMQQHAQQHAQELGPLLATAASINCALHGQTPLQLVRCGKESLLSQPVEAVAATLAAPGSVPPQLLEATFCKDVVQAAQLIRQGLAQCSTAASQRQQQQPVMATQQAALVHATRVAVARSTAAAAAFLGGMVEVLGMQRGISLLQGMLPACRYEGGAQGSHAPSASNEVPWFAVDAQQPREDLFAERLALAVLHAWLPEQRWRQGRACKLQRVVPAAKLGSDSALGSACPVADTSGLGQQVQGMRRMVKDAIEQSGTGQLASQVLGMAEQGADSTARVIRCMLLGVTITERVPVCHALLSAWQQGHHKWLGALRESVLAAVRAS